MYTYRWTGDNASELPGIGIVTPGQEFLSETELNHPHCELVSENAQTQQEQVQPESKPEQNEQENQSQEGENN